MPANTITRGRLRRLTDVHPARGRVLSVFLNLDPTEFATPAARSTAITSVMTEAAHRVEQADELTHEEREALKADLERVRQALSASDIAGNGTRAVAVYACGPEKLLEVVALRRSVESGAVVDRTPHVEPLVADADHERWCVVLVNRRNARFFVGDPHDLEETDRVEDDVHRQHDQGGWSQANYQRSVEKEKADHLVRVAEVAFGAYKRRGFDRLLVGAPEELVRELEHKLHPYLRERIAGRLHLDVDNSSLEDVRGAAKQAIEDWARRCERQELDRLIEGVGRGGRGVAGRKDVQAALDEARVAVLLVAEGFEGAEPEIEKAIEQSARVIVVRHHDDLVPLGGIGAVLRY
jgi:peptide chain release factor subunit 1